MSDSPQKKFWAVLAKGLAPGRPVLAALLEARDAVAGTAMAPAAAALAQAVESGEAMSAAMARQPDIFSPVVVALWQVGESAGAIDHGARQIAAGFADGRLELSGTTDPVLKFWQLFELLLSAGAPALRSLRAIRAQTRSLRLAEALDTLAGGIANGSTLHGPMSRFPEIFPPPVVALIHAGEMSGQVDLALRRIIAAIEHGDLSKLPKLPESAGAASADQPFVAQVINRILWQAWYDRATDIHFEPWLGEPGRVRYRIDGVLYELGFVEVNRERHRILTPPAELTAIVARLKFMAGLDANETRLPQDGRIPLRVDDHDAELRLSVVPTVHGERAALRILRAEPSSIGLDRLVSSPANLVRVRALCALPHGMVVIAGPTGSGKTSLLYGMVREMARPDRCVMSVEDPVEHLLPGVAQVAVSHRLGLTFASAMRAVLRQDPDVVMVGELNDLESVQIALQAAITGQLVLTQLHAPTAGQGLRRLMDLAGEPLMVSTGVAAVIGQRLVRVLCKECRQAAPLALDGLPPEAAAAAGVMKGATFYAAKPGGCPACRGTGYRGRTPAQEILTVDDAVRRLVMAGASPARLRQAAVEAGMETMLVDAIREVAEGVTSVAEIVRAVLPGGTD